MLDLVPEDPNWNCSSAPFPLFDLGRVTTSLSPPLLNEGLGLEDSALRTLPGRTRGRLGPAVILFLQGWQRREWAATEPGKVYVSSIFYLTQEGELAADLSWAFPSGFFLIKPSYFIKSIKALNAMLHNITCGAAKLP